METSDIQINERIIDYYYHIIVSNAKSFSSTPSRSNCSSARLSSTFFCKDCSLTECTSLASEVEVETSGSISPHFSRPQITLPKVAEHSIKLCPKYTPESWMQLIELVSKVRAQVRMLPNDMRKQVFKTIANPNDALAPDTRHVDTKPGTNDKNTTSRNSNKAPNSYHIKSTKQNIQHERNRHPDARKCRRYNSKLQLLLRYRGQLSEKFITMIKSIYIDSVIARLNYNYKLIVKNQEDYKALIRARKIVINGISIKVEAYKAAGRFFAWFCSDCWNFSFNVIDRNGKLTCARCSMLEIEPFT